MGFKRFIKNILNIRSIPVEPEKLRTAVKKAYTEVAQEPTRNHPFPVGRTLAENIGYPTELLDRLPNSAIASFTGVTNISVFADIPDGSTVLDVGCGTGLDSLVAAEQTGSHGRVIGIDFSYPMLTTAQTASRSNRKNIDYLCADAEKLPLGDNSIDVIIVNGIFNLNPFRGAIFQELSRVIKRTGTLYIAELIKKKTDKKAHTVFDLKNWFT